MENQVTNNANALRLFFNEEVFLVEDKSVKIPLFASNEPVLTSEPTASMKEVVASLSVNIPAQAEEETVKPVKPYPESVEIPSVLAEPEAAKTFRFLGGNKKSVLILVNDPHNDVSTEQGRELLRKIVKAVDLGTPDFALVNYANYPGTDFTAFHQFFKPELMLSFGVEISALKLNLTWQNEIILHGSTRIIFAPNLHQLDSDIIAKKSLWGNLQKIK
ncbi:hypothetical protein [Pedobacter sp.]|uniref:hypothetical protein n=1 Tax=Pedobacter sp. TaxID=1411316 RepID=UPI003BA8FFBD